jgi:hypothetical protein
VPAPVSCEVFATGPHTLRLVAALGGLDVHVDLLARAAGVPRTAIDAFAVAVLPGLTPAWDAGFTRPRSPGTPARFTLHGPVSATVTFTSPSVPLGWFTETFAPTGVSASLHAAGPGVHTVARTERDGVEVASFSPSGVRALCPSCEWT